MNHRVLQNEAGPRLQATVPGEEAQRCRSTSKLESNPICLRFIGR